MAFSEFHAEFTEAGDVQAPLHDVERRLLLREEEDRLMLREGVGDDIRDRLRLAGSGRSLDDQVPTPHRIYDGAVLGRVRVVDQNGRGPLDLRVIDGVVIWRCEERAAVIAVRLGSLDHRADERVRDGMGWPVARGEVRIDGETAEGEVSEREPAADLPAPLALDRLAHPREVVLHRVGRFLVRSERWQQAPELALELLL